METSNLVSSALNWAVAQAFGYKVGLWEDDVNVFVCQLSDGTLRVIAGGTPAIHKQLGIFAPDIDATLANKIMSECNIGVFPIKGMWGATMQIAQHSMTNDGDECAIIRNKNVMMGPTPIIACLRAFVKYRLGPEVVVPNEFLVRRVRKLNSV